VFVTSFVHLLGKGIVGISIWIQKLKYERGIEDNNTTLNNNKNVHLNSSGNGINNL
jgi:hypothetical protein